MSRKNKTSLFAAAVLALSSSLVSASKATYVPGAMPGGGTPLSLTEKITDADIVSVDKSCKVGLKVKDVKVDNPKHEVVKGTFDASKLRVFAFDKDPGETDRVQGPIKVGETLDAKICNGFYEALVGIPKGTFPGKYSDYVVIVGTSSFGPKAPILDFGSGKSDAKSGKKPKTPTAKSHSKPKPVSKPKAPKSSSVNNPIYDSIITKLKGSTGAEDGFNILVVDRNGRVYGESSISHKKGYETRVGTISNLERGLVYTVIADDSGETIDSANATFMYVDQDGNLKKDSAVLTRSDSVAGLDLKFNKSGTFYVVVPVNNKKGGKEFDILEVKIAEDKIVDLTDNQNGDSDKKGVVNKDKGFVGDIMVKRRKYTSRVKDMSLGYLGDEAGVDLMLGYSGANFSGGIYGRLAVAGFDIIPDGRIRPFVNLADKHFVNGGVWGGASLGSNRSQTELFMAVGGLVTTAPPVEAFSGLKFGEEKQGGEFRGSFSMPGLFVSENKLNIGPYVTGGVSLIDITQSINEKVFNNFNEVSDSAISGGLKLNYLGRVNLNLGFVHDSHYSLALKEQASSRDLRRFAGENERDYSYAHMPNINGNQIEAGVTVKPVESSSFYLVVSTTQSLANLIGRSSNIRRNDSTFSLGFRNVAIGVSYADNTESERNRTVRDSSSVSGFLRLSTDTSRPAVNTDSLRYTSSR